MVLFFNEIQLPRITCFQPKGLLLVTPVRQARGDEFAQRLCVGEWFSFAFSFERVVAGYDTRG